MKEWVHKTDFSWLLLNGKRVAVIEKIDGQFVAYEAQKGFHRLSKHDNRQDAIKAVEESAKGKR